MADERDYVHSGFGGVVTPADVAPYVLLPAAAAWAEQAADQLEDGRLVTEHYEFTLYTGRLGPAPVTICSTGLGGMSTSIAVEELARLGAHTLLAVGARGEQVDDLRPGEVIIPFGAVRLDGTSQDYVRPEYPAAAQWEMIMAALSAAESGGVAYHTGVVASVAAGEAPAAASQRAYLRARQQLLREQLQAARVWWGGGQEATLFVQASLYGLRAGAVVGCSQDGSAASLSRALTVGLDALRILAGWDAYNAAAGQRFVLPPVPRQLIAVAPATS